MTPINNGSFTGVHFTGLYPIRCWITKKGSITSIQAVNFPTDDDFTNLTPAITSTHLDATIVLCRREMLKLTTCQVLRNLCNCHNNFQLVTSVSNNRYSIEASLHLQQ
uniref:Uncharacterized protein n=1 Tax=Lactuca sativa TaxID=4236 RepID=A0A9R1VFB1_LACSA|nr:hypothetical protein LSAT_V11C500256460 [Lactuca sativa]